MSRKEPTSSFPADAGTQTSAERGIPVKTWNPKSWNPACAGMKSWILLGQECRKIALKSDSNFGG